MNQPNRLEDFLEDPNARHFYNLVGGLSDNLMSTGPHAGTFLTCECCGDTFTLKGQSWNCECCDSNYELKFKPIARATAPITQVKTRKVEVNGLTKPGVSVSNHWYFLSENWCVAEFLNQILRLPPDMFLVEWLEAFGVNLSRPAQLESLLSWPRLKFGPKTIQPDFIASYEQDLVFFEFKRPKGGIMPGREVMGQILFALHATSKLKRNWHLILNPGRNAISTKGAEQYVIEARAALEATQINWDIPEETMHLAQSLSDAEIASHITVVGWERLIQAACEVIQAGTNLPASTAWTRAYVLEGLQYFQSERAKRQLMDAALAQ